MLHATKLLNVIKMEEKGEREGGGGGGYLSVCNRRETFLLQLLNCFLIVSQI